MPTRIYEERDHTAEGLEVSRADLLQASSLGLCSSNKTSSFLCGKTYQINLARSSNGKILILMITCSLIMVCTIRVSQWVRLVPAMGHKGDSYIIAGRWQMNRDHDQRYPIDLIMVSGLFNRNFFETHGYNLHRSCSPIPNFCCANSFNATRRVHCKGLEK